MICNHCGRETENGNYCSYCSQSLDVNIDKTVGQMRNLPQPMQKKPARGIKVYIGILLGVIVIISVLLISLLTDNQPQNTDGDLRGVESAAVSDAGENEATPVASVDLSNLVTDAWTMTTTNSYGDTAYLRVPQINLDSEEIRLVNEQIIQNVNPVYPDEPVSSEIQAENIASEYIFLGYSYAIAGDVLCVMTEGKTSYSDFVSYHIYSIVISEERVAERAELIAASGINPAEYDELVRQILEAKHMEYQTNSNVTPHSPAYEMWQPFLEQTIAQENIDSAVPFLNQNGDLCIIGRVYLPAGCGYTEDIYNLEA